MSQEQSHPLLQLEPEHLDFVERMVLASGSLKELAKSYQVSYPTIRNRLDSVIRRLQSLRQTSSGQDPMSALLADLVEAGQMTVPAAKRIRDTHREILQHREQS